MPIPDTKRPAYQISGTRLPLASPLRRLIATQSQWLRGRVRGGSNLRLLEKSFRHLSFVIAGKDTRIKKNFI